MMRRPNNEGYESEEEPGIALSEFAGDTTAEEESDSDQRNAVVLVDEDENDLPHCCRSGHCCNPKCSLEHVGSAGYSIENAALYSDTAFNFAMTVGLFSSTPTMALTIILLMLITLSLTLGNYRSYLSIMNKFLSRFSCFQYEEEYALDHQAPEEEGGNEFWNAIGIANAILKVLIPSYSVYRVTDTIFTKVFSVSSNAPAITVVTVLGVLSLPSSLAFFDQGNQDRRHHDPDATFDEKEIPVLQEHIDLQEERENNFALVVKNPTVPLFEEADDENELESGNRGMIRTNQFDAVESDDETLNTERHAGRCCCSRNGCCSIKVVLKHSGTAGYSVQNAALYSNSAYSNLNKWGLMDSNPILSGFMLLVVTGSVTIANYNSYLVIMGNFLSRHFQVSEASGDSACQRFWSLVVRVNIFPATFFKVGVSALNFYRVCDRVFFGNVPLSATATALVSGANVLATVGLFSLKTKNPSEGRVVVLSDAENGEEVVESPEHKK